MSITIRETVLDALQANGYGSYSTYAEPVINALVEREQGIYENLHDFAVSKGLASNEATRVFEGVGLTAPTPVVETPVMAEAASSVVADAVVTTLEKISNVLDGLTDRVDNLTQFARNAGYRG